MHISICRNCGERKSIVGHPWFGLTQLFFFLFQTKKTKRIPFGFQGQATKMTLWPEGICNNLSGILNG